MTTAVLSPARRAGAPRRSLPSWLPGVVGVVVILAVWTLIAETVLPESKGFPTPWRIVQSVGNDGWSFYWPIIEATGKRALTGFVIGAGLAIALAFLVLLVPKVEKVVLQVAVASYCLPVLAIGPILTITLHGDQPMIALAALFVVFTTLVGTLLGLRSADATSLDLITAYGGGRWQQMRRVRLFAALPSTIAALQIAAPTAVLGAILGEYLGGTSNIGLGFAMVASEQALEIPRTWGIALVASALGGIFYALFGLIGRFALPWAKATTAGAAS